MYKSKTEPFKHQQTALELSAMKKNFAYFMEMGCVDEETEFLTTRGWVKFCDFDLETWPRPLLVAQAVPYRDTNTEHRWRMEFVEPTAYIKKDSYDWYKLKLASNLQLSHKKRDIYVTGEHTFPVCLDAPRKETKLDMTVKEMAKTSEDMFGFDNVDAMLVTKSKYYEPDPEINSLSIPELRFMIAVAADGTYPNKTNNKCDFYFTKERKCLRIEQIAREAGITLARERMEKRKGNPVTVYHCIAPMRCKVFDERWYTLPLRKLREIVKEVFFWDGTITKKFGMYFTTIKDSADFIFFALTACGWKASISYDANKRLYTVLATVANMPSDDISPLPEFLKKENGSKKYATAKITTPRFYDVTKIDKFMKAYCFRVPSGYLVLRRDTRVFISGNSGKTKVMIDNIGMLYDKEHITGAVILAPKGVYRNWADKEIPTHLSDDINREILVWDAAASPGKKDKLVKQIKNWDEKTLQLMVFNIESLVSDKGKKLLLDFIKRHKGKVLALVDESTCIKNHKAKRTKAAIEIGSKCIVRRIATGSPITNSPLDLFSQCAFLSKDLLGFGSFYAFKNTYANIERVQNRQGFSYERILSYKNLDNLSKKLDAFSFRVTKKECLDLPDKLYSTREVELTPEQKKIYQEMRDYYFTTVEVDGKEKEMSVSVVLTKLLRLHQILCGSFTADDGTSHVIPNNRIDALKEVLEETSGKVIIWATYLQDIRSIVEMIKKEYGDDTYVTYFGETSANDRTKAINLFQDPDNKVRFFIGNVQTAGKGITLTEASTVIYFSNNFSLEFRQQSEDRAHRIGQKNNVTYIDLVVRNSLDEKIIKSLIEKRNIANEILHDDLDPWISLSEA